MLVLAEPAQHPPGAVLARGGIEKLHCAIMSQYAKIQKDLEHRLEVLRRRTSKVETSLRRELNRDSQEAAQEAENDEVLERLDEGGLQEIEAIRNALKRIEAGTYGVCTSCEEPIAIGRLEALPFALRCIDCAD
jgi:RNA polymerase-binding transcription factor DksA